MRIFNSSSQKLYLGITFLFVFIVHLKAQVSPLAILLAHNIPRAEVGVGPLRWDENLADYARDYANKRKDDCRLQHSGGAYGENLAWSSRTRSLTGVEAVKMWVDEKSYYDHKSNSCSPGKICGDYTQVVWRNTHKVGCAKVKCNNNRGTFFICSYDPPGNFNGQRPYSEPKSI